MYPGRGYWVLVTEATTLTIANEGPDPVVEITSPDDLGVVTDFTDVIGTVQSPILDSWRLTYERIGETEPVEIAPGVAPVAAGGVLATFDPTLHWFAHLAEARRVIEAWRVDYNSSARTARWGIKPLRSMPRCWYRRPPSMSTWRHEPTYRISPSSEASRVGFAARASRGYALDPSCGRRERQGCSVRRTGVLIRSKPEDKTLIRRGTNLGSTSQSLTMEEANGANGPSRVQDHR